MFKFPLKESCVFARDLQQAGFPPFNQISSLLNLSLPVEKKTLNKILNLAKYQHIQENIKHNIQHKVRECVDSDMEVLVKLN